MKKIVSALLLFIWIISCTPTTEEVGKIYIGWKMGECDIHHIQTGRGESNFFILPDGTSMLVDAGDYVYDKSVSPTPDSSRSAGEWIARYIQRTNPQKSEVDYLVISHFHNDHTGDCTGKPNGQTGYALCGITEVGEYIRFKTAIDRGWPDYNYPLEINHNDIIQYRLFLQHKITTEQLQLEPFLANADNQIRLQYNPSAYPDFVIRNLAVNGIIRTVGDSTIRYYDLHPQNREGWQNENSKSVVFMLSYGNFNYYTGGDFSGKLRNEAGKQIDLEEEISQYCGAADVCKVNHHGYLDAMPQRFIDSLKASNYIFPVWDFWHIQPSVMNRMVGMDSTRLFTTAIPDTLRQLYRDEPFMSRLVPETGHVVVKVLNGGDAYKIYILDNSSEDMRVKAVYGPFNSRSRSVNAH